MTLRVDDQPVGVQAAQHNWRARPVEKAKSLQNVLGHLDSRQGRPVAAGDPRRKAHVLSQWLAQQHQIASLAAGPARAHVQHETRVSQRPRQVSQELPALIVCHADPNLMLEHTHAHGAAAPPSLVYAAHLVLAHQLPERNIGGVDHTALADGVLPELGRHTYRWG